MKLRLFPKKVRMLFSLFVFFSFYIATAQSQKTITGTVLSSEDNMPLPGASVIEKGTNNGTSTDFDGKFSLNVASDATTLVVSFIGFQEQEVTITEGELTITLLVDANALEEIVVVGYGTQKITKVSGAISTVKSAAIESLKPIRVEEALQGQASGVSVIQGGSPGSKPTVLIRGIPSFEGTDPIVIIDGLPQSLDDLNAINSSDIESINVLKDAATTAIYGVSGGNGVIVVTTKTGRKNQKTVFSYNSYVGQQEVLKKIGVLNASEYGAIINEGSVLSGGPIIFSDLSTLGVGTNWQDEIFKTASISSHNFNARGGSENMSYFLSAGYLGQDGIVGGGDKSNFNRLNITANLNFDLTSKLKLVLNTNYANIKNQSVSENSFNSIIGSALNFDPTVSVFNSDSNTIGTYGFSDLILSEIFNPLTKLENTYNESNGDKFFGKIELQYEILDGLRITSRLGYTKWDQYGKQFLPLVFYGPLNVSSDFLADGTVIDGNHNKVIEDSFSAFSFTYETFANYNFKINEEHNFDVVLGVSLAKSTSRGTVVAREDVPFNSWEFADISSATGTNSSTNTAAYTGRTYQNLTRKNTSYFGRINYDYQDKYLASFSGRRDGSTTFGEDNKFANFFAGSLGWIASKEDFFNSEVINFLKFRASYGISGNDNVQPVFVNILTGGPSYSNPNPNSNGYTFDGVFVPGSTIGSFANETLGWEEQTQLSIGFDITVLNDFSLSADYFEKDVDGLLFKQGAPLIAGTLPAFSSNIGSTESTGFDLKLAYNSTSENFTFNTSITISSFNSLVTETDSQGISVVSGGSVFNGQSFNATRFEKGFSPGYFYGYQTDGLFQTTEEVATSPTQNGAVPGDIKFVDVNGDGVITALDRTKIGDPFPDFTLGWNLGFEYKNFDFSVFTYVSVGNDIFRAYERNANFTNKFRSILDRWTGPGSTNDADNPRYSFDNANANNRPSDRYIEDGSFVKIKNVLLGYTVPSSLYNDKWFSKIRIYAQAKNLFTFTEYSGFDPEISGGIFNTGLDRGAYPQARTISLGIDLKF